MALVTTVADGTSDSYVTLLEVEANLLGPALTAWKNLSSNAEREAYVRKSTQLIDMQMYRGDLFDLDTPQAMAFPRSDNYTLDTDLVTQLPYVPPRVKQAVYSQVSAMLNGFGSGFINQALEYRASGITNLGLGTGNTIAFKNQPVGSKDFLCAEAKALLAPFFSHSTIRLERG